ncbi:28610_t:CDS:2, partial [Gigaspora margarita]
RHLRYYHLVGPLDSKDAPKLPAYQTGEEQFYENGKEMRYGYSKLSPDELEIASKPEYNKEFNKPEEVLNLSTGRWIKFNRKLYKKLLRKGYKYTKDLLQYLEEVPLIDIGEYGTIYPLVNFYHSALIAPLSILA